jgi:tRNA modification GTPase
VSGLELDRALVLWLPGPATATGEDCAELHLHGSRAVVAAVESALAALPGLRAAQAGEFTRRAFLNGRIDLAEAEGLADLLEAETELQRRTAMAMAGGSFSRLIGAWQERLLGLSARVEAALDFSDEDDVGGDTLAGLADGCRALASEIGGWLVRPRAEVLREGLRVVLAGPPNAGKSTLFNILVDSEAAITAADPGTTRDVLVRAVALDGFPFSFVDTAGLREDGVGEVEAIGIARARAETLGADLVLWLGAEGEGPAQVPVWEVAAQCDRADRLAKHGAHFRLSALTGEGITDLRTALIAYVARAMPLPGEAALNARQADHLGAVKAALEAGADHRDLLLVAECLRVARTELDRLTGRTGTEDMLDALFGRFCIGK